MWIEHVPTEALKQLRDVPGVDLRNRKVPYNCRGLLEDLGYDVPEAPRLPPKPSDRVLPHTYEWATEYQQQVRTLGSMLPGLALDWACGAGKTFGALVVAAETMDQNRGRAIIITRSPTRRQWQREAQRFTSLRPRVLEGKSAFEIPADEEVVILSWAVASHWCDALCKWAAGAHTTLILDESHKGKAWDRKERKVARDGEVYYDWKPNRAAALAKISARCNKRLALSATMLANTRMDMWAQLDLLEPGCWGSSWDFAHRYCDAKPGTYGGLDTSGTSYDEEFKRRFAVISHRVSYEEMSRELPPKRRQLVFLGPEDQSRPEGFKAELKRAAKAGANALFEVKLLEASSRKRKWIAETVGDALENGQKVVVFTGRRKDCESLAKLVATRARKCSARFWTGHGGDSERARDQMVQEYAAHEGAGCLVGTTEAFGEAVDGLQNTDLVIFALLPYTPRMVTQAEGRFSRKGSKRSVMIMYVICEGTVDEHVADLLLVKLEQVQTTFDDQEAEGLVTVLAGTDDEDAVLDELLTMMGGV